MEVSKGGFVVLERVIFFFTKKLLYPFPPTLYPPSSIHISTAIVQCGLSVVMDSKLRIKYARTN